jgi:transposase
MQREPSPLHHSGNRPRCISPRCITRCIRNRPRCIRGRKVSDLGFANFVKILEHQCSKAGTVLIKIDRFYPSSKTCSNCGYIYKELSLKERQWVCPSCSAIHDRDENAATNIHRVGTSTLKGEVVRPAPAGKLLWR